MIYENKDKYQKDGNWQMKEYELSKGIFRGLTTIVEITFSVPSRRCRFSIDVSTCIEAAATGDLGSCIEPAITWNDSEPAATRDYMTFEPEGYIAERRILAFKGCAELAYVATENTLYLKLAGMAISIIDLSKRLNVKRFEQLELAVFIEKREDEGKMTKEDLEALIQEFLCGFFHYLRICCTWSKLCFGRKQND